MAPTEGRVAKPEQR